MLSKFAALSLLLGLIAITSSGCTLFDGHKKKPNDKPWTISKLWKKEYQKPNTLSVIWSPDVLTLSGKPPTRGFGGRVFFYNDRTQAVPVEGELIVHGYRGQPLLGESEQVKADKTFAFTAEQLTSHFSPSELGASYSVWIPWDAADGFREEITLIPTFKGLDGMIVQGAPAKLYLPGRTLDGGTAANRTPTGVAQTVSYEQKSIPTNVAGELPRLSRESQPLTIDLPPLASIGRPRTKPSPVQGFTLGGGAVNQATYQAPPVQNANYSNALPYSNNAPLPENVTAPSSLPTNTSHGNLPAVTPLPAATSPVAAAQGSLMMGGPSRNFQPVNPFAHQPWHTPQASMQ